MATNLTGRVFPAAEAELITIAPVLAAGQDGVEIVVDAKMTAAEPVGVTRGQPGDEPGRQRGLGAVAGRSSRGSRHASGPQPSRAGNAGQRPLGEAAGREALHRAIEVARQCGARHVEGIALGVLGVLGSLDCRPAEAIPPLTESLPLLQEAGDVFFLSLSLIGLVQSLSLRGDFEEAITACQELDSISGQLGAAQLYFAPCARGFAAFCRGDWPETIRSFRSSSPSSRRCA